MSDAALKLLLSSMLDELEHTLDDARTLIPGDADREDEGYWEKKPEYANELILSPTEKTHDWIVTGEFEALKPLADWLAKWRERVGELGAKDESEVA